MGTHNEEALSASVALVAASGPCIDSIWRHKKTAGIYRVVCCAIRETDFVPLVVYRPETPVGMKPDPAAVTWVRTLTEFTDGRFTLIKK